MFEQDMMIVTGLVDDQRDNCYILAIEALEQHVSFTIASHFIASNA